jgi:hypothetical protein
MNIGSYNINRNSLRGIKKEKYFNFSLYIITTPTTSWDGNTRKDNNIQIKHFIQSSNNKQSF